MKEGTEVKVKTVNTALRGVVIDAFRKNSSSVEQVYDVRLDNGYLLREVREWEIEVIRRWCGGYECVQDKTYKCDEVGHK